MIPLLMKRNIKSDLIYRGIRPVLDLNFAKNKSLIDDISRQNLITFSRASSGTFVGNNGFIQTAATDVPRFVHNPTTLESLGLLIEEQRTNLVQFSSDFSDAKWNSGNVTVTVNATNAPDGTNTAQLITSTSNAECGFTEASINANTNTTYTSSIFVKQNTCRYALIRLLPASANANCWFDLQAGTVSYLDTAIVSATITPYLNGWYRVSATATVGSSVAYQNRFDFRLTGNNGSVYSIAGQSLYMWGAQVEVGANPSSYIPTTGATVTRAADIADIIGTNFSNWYDQNKGTWYFSYASAPGEVNGMRLIALNSGIAVFALNFSTTSIVYYDVINSSVVVNTANNQSSNKLAFGYDVASTRIVGNGLLGGSSLSYTPIPPTRLYLGGGNGYVNTNQTISRLVFWNNRLADAKMKIITQ